MSTPKPAQKLKQGSKSTGKKRGNKILAAVLSKTPEKRKNSNPTTPKSANFAWSKMQNSPDPSELPIPSFVKERKKSYKLVNKSQVVQSEKQIDKVQLLKETMTKLMTATKDTTKTHDQTSKINSLKSSLGINLN